MHLQGRVLLLTTSCCHRGVRHLATLSTKSCFRSRPDPTSPNDAAWCLRCLWVATGYAATRPTPISIARRKSKHSHHFHRDRHGHLWFATRDMRVLQQPCRTYPAGGRSVSHRRDQYHGSAAPAHRGSASVSQTAWLVRTPQLHDGSTLHIVPVAEHSGT